MHPDDPHGDGLHTAPTLAVPPLVVEARDLARTEADRAQDEAPDPEDYR